MSHRLFALGLASLLACSEGSEEEETISTILAGETHFADQEGPWLIEVFELAVEPKLVAQLTSDDGTFEVDLAYRTGVFLVKASTSEQEHVSVLADVVLDARTEVVLTPITHLGAVYADREIRAGSTIDDSMARARSLVFGHFAGLEHDRIRPYDVKREPAVSFTDDVAAGFLLAGLEELARARSVEAGRMAGTVSVGRLLDAVEADLAADGVLDGRGDRERQLALADRPFDAELLRAELGRAILAFAASEENATVFGRDDLLPLAEALASDRSELFPDGAPQPLDNRGPVFRRWFFERGGAAIDPSRPLMGAVDLVLEVFDDSAIERITLRTPASESAWSGGSPAAFPMDTASFVDGPNEIEVVAVDAHGNEATLVVPFAVDNTAPELVVEEIGRVAGSTLTIRGTVEDEGELVLRALVSGVEVGRAVLDPGNFALDVRVACGRRFIVALQAIDRAGNMTELRREVLCDDTAPIIELLASRFTQERSLQAIHGEDGASIAYVPGPNGIVELTIDEATVWPVRIEKYLNRLDDLDPFGSPGGSNIPRIRVRAVELDGQQVASAWDALLVEYRYLVDGAERRTWQVLPPIGGLPNYEIPISYQSLGTDLATAPPTALHEIEVRVVDEAGLSTTRSFPFGLDLLSPSVLLSSCAKSPVLGAFELGLQNMGVLYGTQPESEAVVGVFAYRLHLPPGSAAPVFSVRALVTPPHAATRIVELSEDKHQANPNHPDNNRPGLNCLSGSHSEVERPSGQYLGCFLGPMPLSRALTRNTQGLNDLDVHPTRMELRRNSGLVLPSADGSYQLIADAPAETRALLVAPSVRFAGITYDWRTAFTLPNGYQFGPHPVRYRVDSTWHEGIERAPYGSFDPPRAYVTRPYVSELEIEIGPISAAIELEGRPDVTVGVQRAATCDAAIIHRAVAP